MPVSHLAATGRTQVHNPVPPFPRISNKLVPLHGARYTRDDSVYHNRLRLQRQRGH